MIWLALLIAQPPTFTVNDKTTFVVVDKTTPAVVVSSTFRNSHQCPTCGRAEYRVAGFNTDGTHTHRCPVDGTTWRH